MKKYLHLLVFPVMLAMFLINNDAVTIGAFAVSVYAYFIIESHGHNKLSHLIPVALIVTVPAVLILSFKLFHLKHYFAAYLIFLWVAFITFSIVFYYDGDRKAERQKWIEPAGVGMRALLVRIAFSLASGVIAYFFLEKKIYVLAYFFYLFSFFILSVPAKNPETAGPAVAAQAGAETRGTDIKKYVMPVFFLAAMFFFAESAYASIMKNAVLKFTVYMAMAVFSAMFYFRGLDSAAPEKPEAGKFLIAPDYIFLVLVTGFAFIIRVIDIYGIPPGIIRDEVDAMTAIGSLMSGRKGVFYPVDSTVMPVWMSLIAYKVLGFGMLLAAKAPQILTGTLNVTFLYLLAKLLYNRRVAVISSLILSVLFSHVLFSRQVYTYIEVSCFATMAFFFMLYAAEKGKTVYAALAGACLALAMYFYGAGKVMPLVVFLYFVIVAVAQARRRQDMTQGLKMFLIITTAAVVVFYPVISYIFSPNSMYFEHTNSVNIKYFMPSQYPAYMAVSMNAAQLVRFFFFGNTFYPFMSLPSGNVFDTVSAVLMLCGAAMVFAGIRRKTGAFLVIWFLASTITAVFSMNRGGFEMPRVVAMLPVLAVFIALGMEALLKMTDRLPGISGKAASWAVALVLMVFIMYFNLHTYFVKYKNDPITALYYNKTALNMVEFIRENKSKKPVTSEFFSGGRANYFQYQMFGRKYIRPSFIDVSLLQLSKLYNSQGLGMNIVAEGLYEKYMGIYREFFPHAEIKTRWNYFWWIYGGQDTIRYCYEWNEPEWTVGYARSMTYDNCLDPNAPMVDFVSCIIPYTDIQALYGLNAVFYSKGAKTGAGIQPDMEIKKYPSFDSAEFSGSIEAPDTGWYVIFARGADLSRLSVNGGGTDNDGCVYLLRGLNRIKFGLKNFTGDAIVYWMPQGGGKAEKIPSANIITKDYTPAVMNYLEKDGKKIYEAYDYAINNRLYWGGSRLPAAAAGLNAFDRVWESSVTVESGGYYSYSVDTPSDCRIYLDGAVVYDKKAGREKIREAFLAKGRHKIVVRQNYGHIPNVGNMYHIRLLVKKKEWALPREVRYDEFAGK